MKVTILFVLFVVVTAFCFGGAVQIGVGLDTAGNHEITGNTNSPNSDVASGISPYLEILSRDDSFLFGLGAEYQIPRKVDFATDDGKMGFIPIYVVARYQLPIIFIIKPELIGQIGYNFLNADDDYKSGADIFGGLYWGLGAGLIFDKLIGQIMYKTNNGAWKNQGEKGDIINTQINFSAGIRF